MSKYTIYEAKNNFSKLIQKVAAGEEVIIMNREEPVAVLLPIRSKGRKWGALKKKIKLNPGWDSPIDDFKDYLK